MRLNLTNGRAIGIGLLAEFLNTNNVEAVILITAIVLLMEIVDVSTRKFTNVVTIHASVTNRRMKPCQPMKPFQRFHQDLTRPPM